MGLCSIFISTIKFQSLLLIFLLFISKTVQKDQGFVSLVISKKGLDFAKDLIVRKAVSSIIPLKLPQIEKHVSVPIVGDVNFVLSNITVYSVDVPVSFVESGETGVVFVALNATAKLSLDWRYKYRSWFVEVSDYGNASIEVQGLNIGVTLAMEDQEGTLKLSVLECGCYVRTLVIKLSGGASWLYQGFVDAFQDVIASQVEETISEKISEGITKVDTFLQSLPKQIPVYDTAAVNVSFVGDPVLSDSSIEFNIDGLFVAAKNSSLSSYHEVPLDLVASNSSITMVEISLHEKVFNSLSSVFFNAGYLHLVVDEVTDQSLLNTSSWKYIIPKLYKKYPNDAMKLNILITSPPIVKVLDSDIDVTIYSDVVIDVLDDTEDIPVLCISLEISALCSPKMVGNKLVGTLKLRDFKIFSKWSKVGNLHMHLIQSVMSVILKRIVIPYVNVYLWKGIPLPILDGLTLRNSEISCIDSKLVICSDVAFVEHWRSLHYASAKLL